ncbi:hypothetical protein MIR68_011896 [Amoeboaphelidium protococcarum]|nr:hypothetical protein MIR68_011896 [Amoeboaphelidium protococcarum]
MYPMSKNQLHKLLLILSQTIAYMHSQHIVHCDLKPQNVLLDVDENGWLIPILSDLGISAITEDSALLVQAFQVSQQRGLSLSYAAPELLTRFRMRFTETQPLILKAGDMYALSIIMVNLLTRAKPWSVQQRFW